MVTTATPGCYLGRLLDLKSINDGNINSEMVCAVINIAEDICVSGCGNFKEEADLDHDKNLTNLSVKCCKHYIRLTITINGHKLTDKGVEPDPAKVDAITKMPTPTDKAGVQRFVVCANT